MLHFILHHAGLELVTSNGNELVQHPAIQNDMKRRKKKNILLDLAVHHSAIPSEMQHQRGRPDIVHLSILEYLFSIKPLLAKKYKGASIKLYIHTRHNRVLEVPADWRAPVSYIRFRGLMEKLLVDGSLSTETSIPLQLRNDSLESLITSCEPTRIINCSKDGNIAINTILTTLPSIYLSSSESWIILIGGYQKGSISLPDTILPVPESVSIFDISVPSWKILGFLLDTLISELVFK